MSNGKEVVTQDPLEKPLRKELKEWCDYYCYYQKRHVLLNLTKIKLATKKKFMQFEKSALKKIHYLNY